jgi:hypothetical protein
MRLGLPLLALLLSLLPLAAQARILSIHDLAAAPKRYDGQLVTVRAFADFRPHRRVLLQSRNLYGRQLTEGEMGRSCIEVYNTDLLYRSQRQRLERINGHTLTVSGVFLADKYNGGEGIDLFSCQVNKWAIAVEKLYRVDP